MAAAAFSKRPIHDLSFVVLALFCIANLAIAVPWVSHPYKQCYPERVMPAAAITFLK
jgi:hypothetical protein